MIHYENDCGYNIAYAIVEISYSCNLNLSLKTDVIYKARGSHWSQQVSAMATTRLQRDQTPPLSAKGVACAIRIELCIWFLCSELALHLQQTTLINE